MRNPEDILSNLCKHSSETSYKYERLYRNLFNEQMFYVAYQRIYAKPGNMTPGSDGQSIDQMSTQRIDALISSLKDESYQPRRVHIRLRPEQLVALYNGVIRGFYEYYSLAHNIGKVGNAFGYVMKYSLYKTLAAKYRCQVGSIKSRFRKDKDFVVTYKDAKGKMKHTVLYNGGFTIKNANKFSNVDNLPQAVINVPYPTLAERLMDKCCELCGKEGEELVMHHVRKLTILKGDKPWEQLMLKRHRKTLAVCNECMQLIAAK